VTAKIVGSDDWLALFKLSSNPRGIPTTVEHSPNSDRVVFNLVIDSERKSTTQEAIKAFDPPMNSRVQHQRIDISKETIEEVVTDAWVLSFVESETCQ